jgi:geranylgeranyl pyrophosphate synthase
VTDAAATLEAAKERLDPFLEAILPAADAPPGALHAAMRQLVFPGGKRFRPALVFAGCAAAGGAPEVALPAAAAVELLHTYSLVHDDLPCMDDDALRRGQPTVHVVHGEAVAVLAGDALQALAFEALVADPPGGPPVPAEVRALATRDLALAAGSRQLVGGQVDDLAFELRGADDATRIEAIHARKSAALIAASIVLGARYGGAGPALLDGLGKAGHEAGVAFQIADDLLDRDDDEPCSLVRVLGEGEARDRASALLESALGRLADLGEEAAPLRELLVFAVRRDR